MPGHGPIQIVESRSNAARLAAARGFVEARLRQPVLVVGASREAVDDFVREIADERGASFGLHRFSFMQLVAFLAAGELAEAGTVPGTALGLEAVAARSAFAANDAGSIPRLAQVCRFPGFARALAATLRELRHARIASSSTCSRQPCAMPRSPTAPACCSWRSAACSARIIAPCARCRCFSSTCRSRRCWSASSPARCCVNHAPCSRRCRKAT
jgi:hypothetical protein